MMFEMLCGGLEMEMSMMLMTMVGGKADRRKKVGISSLSKK